jgi:hypothetical protein
MEKVNFWEIFKKAWQITWHHKYLWWLGLFAGSSAGFSFNFPSGFQKEVEKNNWTEKITTFAENNLSLIIGVILFFIVVFIALELFKILAYGALVQGIIRAEKGELTSFGKLLGEGKLFFARILGMRILLTFLVLALLVVLTLPVIFLFSAKAMWLGSLAALMAIIILIPTLITLSFVSDYASFYIIGSNLPLKLSLEQGYKIFTKNIGPSLIMSLLFIPVSFAAGIILILPIIFLAVISVFLGFILYQVVSTLGIWIAGSIAGVLFLGLLLFIRSVFSVFSNTAWFLFFQSIATIKKEEVEVKKEELILEKEIQPEKA